MLNGYPDSTYGKIDGHVVPSCYSFSKLQNLGDGGFAWISGGFIGLIGTPIGIVGLVDEGLVGLTVLLPTLLYVGVMIGLKLIRGHEFGRLQKFAEDSYNKMPKAKRKEYKNYLIAAYKSNAAAQEAEDLFSYFEVDQKEDLVRKSLTTELEQVKEAARREAQIKREAEKIYEQSLKEVK